MVHGIILVLKYVAKLIVCCMPYHDGEIWLKRYFVAMVGENIEIYFTFKLVKIINLSTVVGENFQIYFSQMAKIKFTRIFQVAGHHEIH